MSIVDAVEYIRSVDENDFEALICACQMYSANKESDNPVRVVGESALDTIRGILEKYSIVYVDDL